MWLLIEVSLNRAEKANDSRAQNGLAVPVEPPANGARAALAGLAKRTGNLPKSRWVGIAF
jgi:hypothetical protein